MSAAELETALVSISLKLPGADYYKRVCGKFVAAGVLQGDYLTSMLIAKEPDLLDQDHDVPTLRSIITERRAFVAKVQPLLPTTSNWYVLFCLAS